MADAIQVDPSQVQAAAGGSLQVDPSQVQPAKSRTWLDQLTDIPKGIWDSFTQGGQAIVNTVAHPIQTMENIGASQDAVRQKAEAAFKKGNYAEGVRHVLNYLVPMVGPSLDASGDMAQQGQVGRAVGQTIGTAAQLAGPKLLEGIDVPVTPAIANPNATEAAALDYLQSKGVPVPAGARTGNAFVKNAQKAADVTPIGAVVAQRSEAAATDALKAEASSQANRAYPLPVVPEQAGAGVRTALGNAALQRAQEAETSYNTFRQMEQQTPMQVDISGIKGQLRPIYQEMQQWMQPALRNASQGYQAVQSILSGPDIVPASTAEAGLGGLKALAREGAGRNSGLAKFIVPQLQGQIDTAVKAVDPHALVELQAGRAAAAAQYGTQEVLNTIREEPVQAFNQMTYAKDAGIDLLRKVQTEAPGEMRKLGRAWLENAFDRAQQEGGFGHAAQLYQNWENLGPQTKRLLFSPSQASDLDKFFLGAKKLAENPNPSGTAVLGLSAGSGMLAVTNPTTGVPLLLGAGALSKMLHSPAGVQALLNGLRVPLKGPGAVLAAGQILKAAGADNQQAQPQQ